MAYTRIDAFEPSPPFNFTYTGYHNSGNEYDVYYYNMEMYIKRYIQEYLNYYNVIFVSSIYTALIISILFILIKDLYQEISNIKEDVVPVRKSRKRSLSVNSQEAIKRRRESLRSYKEC